MAEDSQYSNAQYRPQPVDPLLRALYSYGIFLNVAMLSLDRIILPNITMSIHSFWIAQKQSWSWKISHVLECTWKRSVYSWSKTPSPVCWRLLDRAEKNTQYYCKECGFHRECPTKVISMARLSFETQLCVLTAYNVLNHGMREQGIIVIREHHSSIHFVREDSYYLLLFLPS